MREDHTLQPLRARGRGRGKGSGKGGSKGGDKGGQWYYPMRENQDISPLHWYKGMGWGVKLFDFSTNSKFSKFLKNFFPLKIFFWQLRGYRRTHLYQKNTS